MIPDHDEGIRQLKYAYDKGINVSPPSRPFPSFSPYYPSPSAKLKRGQ